MGISDLLEDVEEQKEKRSVVYDADGIIFLSAYKFKETQNIELIYADFFMRIAKIESELWKSYEIENTVIALTSKKNFRNDLTDKWKDDRKKDTSTMNAKQLEAHTEARELKLLVSKVKGLLNKRMSLKDNYGVLVNNIAEADDSFINLTNNHGYLGVTMDSDCINQSTSPIFNYHSKHWKWMHEGRTEKEVFSHIIVDTITGGHNGSFGIKGKGKVFAEKFIAKLEDSEVNFVTWTELFPTPEEAILNYRVADCSQVVDGKLELQTIESISDMFDTYYPNVF